MKKLISFLALAMVLGSGFYPPGSDEPAFADLATGWLLQHTR
jgi:hypothetical protein